MYVKYFTFFMVYSLLMGSAVSFSQYPEGRQVSISTIGWDGTAWLIGGSTLKIIDNGFAPQPLLVKYDGSFTDVSFQLDIGDRIIDDVYWNGEYWLIRHSFHEYGGLIKYDGKTFSDIPLPGEPLSLRVTACGWNGEYWLIGGGYMGYGYVLVYNGDTTEDVSPESLVAAVHSLTWVGDSWLIFGIDPSWSDTVVQYDGHTFTEVHTIENLDVMKPVWNGEYLMFLSDGVLVKFCDNMYEEISADQLSALVWNGEYWLIGGYGKTAVYDGVTVTGLEAEFTGAVQGMGWNGEYWLIGDSTGMLKMYDGETFEDLTDQFMDALQGTESPELSSKPIPEFIQIFAIILILIVISIFFLKKRV
jgi:hypothetical protein